MTLTNAEKQARHRQKREQTARAAAEAIQRQADELAEARAQIADLENQILALAKHIARLTSA